ncbi:hypothetical protein VTK56DRAFT_4792 [Thermocarpiscus australiensis]
MSSDNLWGHLKQHNTQVRVSRVGVNIGCFHWCGSSAGSVAMCRGDKRQAEAILRCCGQLGIGDLIDPQESRRKIARVKNGVLSFNWGP